MHFSGKAKSPLRREVSLVRATRSFRKQILVSTEPLHLQSRNIINSAIIMADVDTRRDNRGGGGYAGGRGHNKRKRGRGEPANIGSCQIPYLTNTIRCR